jgi:hypothetical protein
VAVQSAKVVVQLTVIDEPPGAPSLVNASAKQVRVDGANVSQLLSASSTPPVDRHGVGTVTLAAGVATLDLTSLTDVAGNATVSLSAKKPRAVIFRNQATNSNPITIAKGASNGYTGFGSTFSLTLQPGQEVLIWLSTNGTAPDGTHKTLDISGTGTEKLDYQAVAGT